MKGSISTKGFAEYLERIAAAGRNVDLAVHKALSAGGEVAKSGMRRRAPKDTHNLESQIDVTAPEQDGNYSFVKIGLVTADAETARYGNAQEFGTSSMAAQPYVRPTMDEDKRLIQGAMRESLKESEIL